jgi:hypothetical protein
MLALISRNFWFTLTWCKEALIDMQFQFKLTDGLELSFLQGAKEGVDELFADIENY